MNNIRHLAVSLLLASNLLPHAALGDENLLTVLSSDEVGLTREQVRLLQGFRSDPATVNVDLVRAHPAHLATEQPLRFLPQIETFFETTHREQISESDFSWYGQPVGTSIEGEATFVVLDGGESVAASIRLGPQLYRLLPLGRDLQALIEIDPDRLPEDHPPAFEELVSESRQRVSKADLRSQVDSECPEDDGSTIRVLVAYTPAARQEVGNIDALIRQAIEETNGSYWRSQVPLRVELADSYETSYQETNDMAEDLDRFTNPGDSHMDEVHARRDAVAADVAVLITTRHHDYCGYAWVLADETRAFAVVNQICATGYYSFAHEIGHLHGTQHNPEVGDWAPFAYGHGYLDPARRWRTVMAYDCPNRCPRLQNWSNPDVRRSGVPMGTATTHNNARVLRETALRVANFRRGPCPAFCTTPPAGMVGWWPLDECCGRRVKERVHDFAGSPRPGPLGRGGPQPVAGRVDGALRFDGIDDYITIPSEPALNFGTGDFSIDAWIRTRQDQGLQVVVDKRKTPLVLSDRPTTNEYRGYQVYLHRGKLGIQLSDGKHTNYTSTASVADGEWHHFAVVVDRSGANRITWFLDGVQVNFHQRPRTGNLDNTVPLLLGVGTLPKNSFFKGDLDELEILNRALSEAEIAAICDAREAGKCKTPELKTIDRSSAVLGDGAGVHTYPALTGDVDGNGTTDLIFVGQGWSGDGLNVRVKLSDGDGTWTAKSQVLGDGPGIHKFPALTGDVNGDSKTDLIFVGQGWSGAGLNVRVKLSNSDGTWTAKSQVLGDGPSVHKYPTLTGDVNGDDKTDLIFVGQGWSGAGLNVRVKLSNGDGRWIAKSQVLGDGSGVHRYPAFAEDVNGDCRTDLIFVGQGWSGEGLNVRVKLSDGDGTWTAKSQVLGDGSGVHFHPAFSGDFNKDGRADLVFIGQGWDGVGLNARIKLSNGDGSWTPFHQVLGDGGGVHTYPAHTGDATGDGRTDLIFVGQDWSGPGLNVRVKSPR